MRGRTFKTILKSGRISWGYVHDAGHHETGKRRQVVRKGFETKREAVDALHDALSALKQRPALSHKSAETFREFMERWMTAHGAKSWGKMTDETNRRRAAYAIRKFGEVPVQQLSAARIQADLDSLLLNGGRKTKDHPDGSPLSRKTVREITALVSMALGNAAKQGKIERNPVEDVDRVKSNKREVPIMEPQEYENLLERVRATRYYALIVFAAASACRRGEILALKWRDIDLESGLVTVSKSLSVTKAGGIEIKLPKSGRTRFIRISPMTVQVLLEHRARLDAERELFGEDYASHGLVFPAVDGSYYSPDQITNRIAEFMHDAGIDASLHSLRHFSASMMLANNVPITVVSKRLGHANPQVTLAVYSHAMKADELTAAQTWDDATSDIIARTRVTPKVQGRKAPVIFRDPGAPIPDVSDSLDDGLHGRGERIRSSSPTSQKRSNDRK